MNGGMTIDELPNGWNEIGFEELNSFSSSTINPADFPHEVFELYSVPIFPTRKPEILKGAEIGSTKQMVAPDDVLICKINPRINRVWKVMSKTNKRQIASSEWIAMRAVGMNPEFLRAYFSSQEFREILCEDLTGVGGSLTRAQPKRVAKFRIPFPPLAEQKRIADKLEVVLGRVDTCRARLDRVPALLKRFRQSVLAAAMSGKLTEEWRLTNEVSDEREHLLLGKLLTDIRYGTAKKCHYEPVATPVLRIPNIGDGNVKLDDIKFAEFEESERRTLELMPGDLLLIRSNGSVELVGRIAVVSQKEAGFLYAGYLIRLRVNPGKAIPDYVALSLRSPVTRSVIELTARSTSGVNNINTEEIKSLSVNLPSLPEQQEIVRRVEDLFTFADRIEARLATAQKTVERLTPATLAKAFRGELVPQDPNDEPASQILEGLATSRTPHPTKRRTSKT